MKHPYLKLNTNADEQKGCSVPGFVIQAGIQPLKNNYVRMKMLSKCIYCIGACMIISISAISQELNYGYENWPFKDAISKEKIVFPTDLAIKYNMYSLKVTNQKAIAIRFAYLMNDTIKHYCNLRIYLSLTAEQAQLDMLRFLNDLTASIPRLTNGSLASDEVVFGEERNGIFLLLIVRNNVFFWIQAPTQITKEIANRIIECIDQAPELKEGLPSFLPLRLN